MPEIVKSKSKSNSAGSALVIGGAGFVGSYICESLLAQNLKVIALDDLSSGKEEYIEGLKKDKSFQFIKVDIDHTPLPEFPDAKYIFHIGGIESYINGLDLSLKTMLVNSIGTYNILELTRKNNAKLLLASSLDIYGGVLSSLNLKNYFGQSERDAKKYTHHEAKRYAEALVTEYYRKYEIDARIVRVADVYGPRMDLSSGTEIAQLFQEATNSDSLTVHGDGLKTIHPTFVSDVVAGITKAMFTQNTQGKIYNITAHDEINVLNFAYTVQKNSTKPLKIQFTQEYKEVKFPLHPTEIQQTESELAWSAKTNLAEGVTQTLEYFYLKLPKEKISNKAEKEASSTTRQSPTAHTNTVMLENMVSKEVKSVPAVQNNTALKEASKETATPPDKQYKKVNFTSTALVSTSLFIVLVLFIFPLTALFSANTKSINSTADALSQETIESATLAQKNISFGNVQYNNLEWFFNTIQKRSAFENTRTSLQALDKLNVAIASQAKLKTTSGAAFSSLMKGSFSSSQKQSFQQHTTATFLNIQNAVIENETAKAKSSDSEGESLLSQEANSELSEILKNSSPTLQKYAKQTSLIQNSLQFLSPSQGKSYLVLLQDTLIPNKNDGKIVGYAYFQLSSIGIIKTTIQQYQYKNNKNAVGDTIKDIVDSVNESGLVSPNAIFVANTNTLKNLVLAQGSVTSPSLAQIVSSNDIDAKLLENRSNSEFQFNIWKETINALTTSNDEKLTKIGVALNNSIQHDDIKIIAADTKGSLIIPYCDTDRVLQKDFVDTDESKYPVKSAQPYCISLQERQLSVQMSKETQKNMQITASPNTDSITHFKLIYSLKNNSKSAFSEDVEITLPGVPQLTNVQFGFPLSLDKARAEKRDTITAYTINIAIEPGMTKDLILEWTSKNSEGDVSKDGIYIAKPYGTVIETITTTISKVKLVTNSVQNADQYLN